MTLMRIRIQLFILMWIRIQLPTILQFHTVPHPYPPSKNNAISCGSGSNFQKLYGSGRLRIQLPKIMRIQIRIRNPAFTIYRTTVPHDCFVISLQGVPTAVPAEGDEEPGLPGAAGGAARLLYPPGTLPCRPQPPPPKQREGAAGRPA